MSNVLDKVRKLKASRPRSGNSRMRGIFHKWNDGDNMIRLVGEFLEVKTHFIAPAPKRNDKGLCRPDSFQGDERLPMVMNCSDWDVEKEEWKKHKTCPICKLNAVARDALKLNPGEEEKKEFKELSSKTYPRPNLKWNIIDRDDPYVLKVEDDKEEKVKGLKIATVGMEAWGDIEGIFDQVGFDITDEVEGIDIKVNKGNNGTRTSYSAQAVLEGKSLKTTPLTDEEKELVPHDLKQICGKQVEVSKVVDALHEEYRDILELSEDEDSVPEEKAEEESKEAAEDEKKEEESKEAAEEEKKEDDSKEDDSKEASAEKKAEEKAEDKAEVDEAIDEAIEEDGDGLLDGTDDSQKKS